MGGGVFGVEKKMNLCQKGSHFSFLNPSQQVRAVLLTSGRWFLFSGEKFFCRCLFGFLCGRKYTVQVLFRTLRPLDEELAVFLMYAQKVNCFDFKNTGAQPENTRLQRGRN